MQQVPARVSEYAQRQFGLVTRAQALEGLSSSGIERRVASGVFVPAGWGVYRLAGAPLSWRQRAMAACLSLSRPVAVSHLAAAHPWRARSDAVPLIQLTVPPSRRSMRLCPAPHRLPLWPIDVTERWAIPTTTPARTVIDLSAQVGQAFLERIVDDLVRDRHLSVSELAQRMACPHPLPRYRVDVLRRIVAFREGWVPGASPREDWVFDSVLAAGLARPERNVMVTVHGHSYELDLAYPELKIGIEYDGWGVHGDAPHFHSDRDKLAALQLDGWLIFQVTSSWSAELVVERVGAAIEQRRAAAGGAPAI